VVQSFDALVRRRLGVAAVQLACHCGVQRVVDERALAAAADACDAGQQADGDLDIHIAQVVAARADDAQAERRGAEAAGRAAFRRNFDAQHLGQVLASE
jgi:hypothetical protein